MKKIAFTSALLLLLALLTANYVERMPIVIDQPDGCKLDAFVTGDEFYHRVHDARGYTLLRQPGTGFAVYAERDGQNLRATDHVAGTVDPASLGIEPNLRKKFDTPPRRQVERQTWLTSGSKAPPVGNVHNLVVFVRFAGENEFTEQYSAYNNTYNGVDQTSLRDFYLTQSSGQLTIDSHLYPTSTGTVISVQVDSSRSYYQPFVDEVNENGYETDAQESARHFALVSEIVALVAPLVDPGIDFDLNNNGVLDSFNIIFRGSPDHWGDLLWPMSWGVNNAFGQINGLDVKLILQVFQGSSQANVVCHEMGHNIGAPDFYHYTDDEPWASISPVGTWDIMGTGSLSFWTTHSKWKYGTWFATVPEIVPTATETTYTLTAADIDQYSCYKIASTEPDQYYMLEYRRRTGRYDGSVPGSGLIVYRVMTGITGNAGAPPDEVYIYRPGGDLDSNGNLAAAAFSSNMGRTAFNNYTDPEPWLYENTSTMLDGNLVVLDVDEAGGETISFVIANQSPSNWTGAVSSDWNVAGNWLNNSVPGPDSEVLIPVVGSGRYPQTSSANGFCKSLVVAGGANLTVNAFNLTVYTYCSVQGQLRFNSTGVLAVLQSVVWKSGSTVQASSAAGGIVCYGDMTIEQGATPIWGNGIVKFTGSFYDSVLYNYSSTNRFWDLRLEKSGGKSFTFAAESSHDPEIYNDLSCSAGSIAHCDYQGWIKLKGDLLDAGTLQWDNGKLYLMGVNQSLQMSTASHLNEVHVYSQTTLGSDITVNGDFYINGGSFDPGVQELLVWGDLYVMEGVLAMASAAGKITVDGDFIWKTGSSANATAGDLECFDNWVVETGANLVLGPAVNTYLSAYYGASIRLEPAGVQFGNLIVNGTEENPRFWIESGSAYSFTVAGNLTVNATNELDIMDRSVTVGGNVNLYGELEVSQGEVLISGRPSLYAGSSLNIDGGSFTWTGTAIPTTTNLYGTLNLSSGSFGGNRHILNVAAGSVNNVSGGTIQCTSIVATAASTFRPTGGTIEILTTSGHTTPMLNVSNGNWLHNLKLNTAGGISLGGDLVLKGGLELLNGNLDVSAGNRKITLAGNWANLQGEAYFDEQAGRVVFNGEEDQYIIGSEVFNIIENANSGGAIALNNTSYSVTCAAYDAAVGYEQVQISAGSFTASDLLDDGIFGSWAVQSRGVVNLTNPDGPVDIRGGINLSGGTLNVHGGSGPSWWAEDGNTSITISAGLLNFASQGIVIGDSSTLYENISGGTIRTGGSFTCNNAAFTPSGGRLDLVGSADCGLSLIAGSHLWGLRIDKSAPNTVTAATALVLKDDFTLAAGAFAAGGNIEVGGDWVNTPGPDSFSEGSYQVNFNGTALQRITGPETFYTLRVANTGGGVNLSAVTLGIRSALTVVGNLTLAPGSTVLTAASRYIAVSTNGRLDALGTQDLPILLSRLGGTGDWYLSAASGGTIAAEHVTFEYLYPTAIQITATGLVDPDHAFNYCTFQHARYSGVHLRLENSQDLVIQGANFPVDNGGYNVIKQIDAGSATFVNATGILAGEEHDYDNNNRLNWTAGVAQITSLEISYQGGNALLNWTCSPAHDNFRIYRSADPAGIFLQVGSSATTTWSEAATGERWFYRVTAYQPD